MYLLVTTLIVATARKLHQRIDSHDNTTDKRVYRCSYYIDYCDSILQKSRVTNL